MRIPGTKVWRAFPELDRFDDDQCARFVRGARRSRAMVIRVLLGALIVVVGIITMASVGLAGAGLVVAFKMNKFGQYDWRGDVRDIVLVVLVGGAGLMSGLLLRDRLLRKRITWVIAHRGSCSNCHYVLLGLPVDAQLNVICPECGVPTPVDASLGELSTDERGVGRFTPKQESIVRPWLTPEQWRRVWKWTVGLAIAALIIGGSWWGWRELQIRRQAELARAERNGVAVLTRFMEEAQLPGVTGSSPNGFEAMMVVADKLSDLEHQVSLMPEGRAAIGDQKYFEYSYVGKAIPDVTRADDFKRERAGGAVVLQHLSGSGVVEAMDAMSRCERADALGSIIGNASLLLGTFDQGRTMRQLARFNAARMRLAAQRGDVGEVASALQANLALSRFGYTQPMLIAGLVGLAIDALTYDELRTIIIAHPSAAMLDAIDETMSTQRPRADWAQRMWQADQETMLDTIREAFSDASFAKRGQWRKMLEQLNSKRDPGREGDYIENRDAIMSLTEARCADSAIDPYMRAAQPAPQLTDELGSVKTSRDTATQFQSTIDQIELMRRGTTVMVAIERFQLVHARYPATLDELGETVVSKLPRDPWSGRQFGYRVIDPSTDETHRGYLLYSVARDGQDNGGLEPTGSGKQYSIHPRFPEGFDFVINQPPLW